MCRIQTHAYYGCMHECMSARTCGAVLSSQAQTPHPLCSAKRTCVYMYERANSTCSRRTPHNKPPPRPPQPHKTSHSLVCPAAYTCLRIHHPYHPLTPKGSKVWSHAAATVLWATRGLTLVPCFWRAKATESALPCREYIKQKATATWPQG